MIRVLRYPVLCILVLLAHLASAQHYQPQEGMQEAHAIFLTTVQVNGSDLNFGDEVGVFSGETCVASQVFMGFFTPMVSTAHTPGNEIIFKIWDTLNVHEYDQLNGDIIVQLNNGDRNFNEFYSYTDVSLYAYDVYQPWLTLSEDVHDFGQVYVGYDSEPWLLVVSNEGAGDLEVYYLGVDEYQGIFTFEPTSFTIEPGESLSVNVVFSPEEEFTYQTYLVMESNIPPENHYSLFLTGEGVPAPHFIPVEGAQEPHVIVIDDALIEDEELSIGDEIGVFSSGICVAALIIEGGGVFTEYGPLSATAYTPGDEIFYRIWDDSDQYEFTQPNHEIIRLINSGERYFGGTHISHVTLYAFYESYPWVTVSENSHDFGDVNIGDQSDSWILTFTNRGTRDYEVDNITALDYPYNYEFNPSSFTVGIDESFDVEVTFIPDVTGNYQTYIGMEDNHLQRNSFSVLLDGDGVFQPIIDLSQDAIDFGYVGINTTETVNLIISNIGISDLTLLSITLDGDDAFTIDAGQTMTSLAPDESTNLPVSFSPTDVIAYTATITIISNDPEPTRTSIDVPLSGQGATPPILEFVYPNDDDNLFDDNETYTIIWTAESGSPIEYIVLHYSLDDGDTWDFIDSLINFELDTELNTTWTTPAATYSVEGLLRLIGLNEASFYDTTFQDFDIGPFDLTKAFDEGWSLASVPLATDDNDPYTIFDGLETPFFTYSYSPEEGYIRVGMVERGEGYWMAVTAASVAHQEDLPEIVDTEIPLDFGWQLIGAMYPVTSPIESLQITDGEAILSFTEAALAGWIDPNIYGYDQDTGYILVEELHPWSGYWLLSYEESLTLLMSPPPCQGEGNVELAPPEDQPPTSEKINSFHRFVHHDQGVEGENWEIPIQFKLGSVENNLVSIGVLSDATPGYDLLYDSPAPPSPPNACNYLKAFIEHPEWEDARFSRFRCDFRSLDIDSPVLHWQVRLESSTAGLLEINFNDIHLIPEGFQVEAVFDNRHFDLLHQSRIEVPFTGNGRLDILVFPTLNSVVEHPSSPEEFAITEVHPNPFNPTVQVDIAVPMTTELSVVIYNVLGKEAARLHEGIIQAGVHPFIWQAAQQPSGIYFVKATSDVQGWNEIRKLMLVK